jgi:hypothetical protein
MLTSALLVGWMLAGQAAPAADDDLRLEVRRLVRQLDATQLVQREAAEEELLKLGPRVLELLPPVTDRASAEVKQRLGRIRQKLQRAAAEAATRPSLITLRGKAVPLSKVLAVLQEQSGNKIVDFRQRFGQEVTDPQLNVEFDRKPFWEALAQVLDQAKLSVYNFGESGAISLVGRDEAEPPQATAASYGGPFRFQPVRLVAIRDLRDPKGQSLRLVLSVAWEPRLKPISLKQRMADLKVVDENGNPLAVDDTQAELEVPAGRGTSVELTLPLKLPPRDVHEIASLKGKLTACLPGKIETFRFGALTTAKNVEERIAGATVTLEQVRQNGSIWEVRMRVRFDEAGQALESHRGWILNNEAYLEDPDGKPVAYDNLEITGQSESEIGLAYGFVLDRAPQKYHFVYKTPGVIVATGVDYEIKNLKLP